MGRRTQTLILAAARARQLKFDLRKWGRSVKLAERQHRFEAKAPQQRLGFNLTIKGYRGRRIITRRDQRRLG